MNGDRKVTVDIRGLCDQRDELNQEIQSKIALRPEPILKKYHHMCLTSCRRLVQLVESEFSGSSARSCCRSTAGGC